MTTDRELLLRVLVVLKNMQESGYNRKECTEAINAICARLAQPDAVPVASNMVRVFNEGYMLGHHDTVEAQFTDIHHSDMDTYHSELVSAQSAALPLTDEQIALAIFNARMGHSLIKRDGTTSFRIARAAIAKFCEVNGIT